MKKIGKIVLLLIAAFVMSFTLKVKAISFAVSPIGEPWDTNLIIGSTGNAYHNNQYIATDNNGNQYSAYCLDPSKGMGYSNFNVIQLGVNSKGRQYAYEMAMLSILENSKASAAYTDGQSYLISSAALRTTTSAFGMTSRGYLGDIHVEIERATIYSAAEWISKSKANYIAWYQAFYGQNPPKALSGKKAKEKVLSQVLLRTNAGYNIGEVQAHAFTGTDAAAVKKLFIKGLKAAATARMKNGEAKKVNYKLKLKNQGLVETVEKNGKTYSIRNIVYAASTSVYENGGYINNFQISSNYAKYMTLEYSTDGKNYKKLDASTNLVNVGKAAKVDKVYVRIHIEAEQSFFDKCPTIKYKLTYSYYDPSFDHAGYILVPYDSAYTQRYYVYQDFSRIAVGTGNNGNGKKANEKTDSIEGTTKICEKQCNTSINIPTDCTELKDESINTQDVISQIKAPEDVETCVLKGNDDAGNSYRLTNACMSNGAKVSDTNPYCSVWCKEDYATVRFSGIKQAQSGRYFKVNGKISGTKTCYTSSGAKTSDDDNAINIEKYEKDIANAQKALIDAYSEYVKVQDACTNHNTGGHYEGNVNIPTYTVKDNGSVVITGKTLEPYAYNTADCGGLVKEAKENLESARDTYDSINKKFNQCTNWDTNDLKLENTDIIYTYAEQYSDMINKEQQKMNKKTTKSRSDYWYCTGNVDSKYNTCSTTATNKKPVKNVTYTVCDTSGCKKVTETISTTRYMKRSYSATNEYETKNLFYNIYTSGEITAEDVKNKMDGEYVIVEGSPVSVKTKKGLYKFFYNIDNLGEFYDTCETGRISDQEKTNTVSKKQTKDNKYKFDNQYICEYTVNCPECRYECEPNDCEWVPSCPECETTCINCIFDADELQVDFRTITTDTTEEDSNPLNPNDRNLGYNWNENTEYNLVSEKAAATIKEIEEKGATIENEEPILSVTMTPTLAKEIREYNKQENSYTNDSLTCYDYNDKYQKIFCYSNFLDDMISKYSSSFKTSEKREEATQRGSSVNKKGYWELFNTTTNYSLGEYNGEVGGPSWK